MTSLPTLPISPDAAPDETLARERIAQQLAYSHCEALIKNESFQYFLRECVQKRHDEQQQRALDDSLTSEQCDLARKQRKLLEEILKWTAETCANARTFIETTKPQT